MLSPLPSEVPWTCGILCLSKGHVSLLKFFLNTGRLRSAGSGCRNPFPTFFATMRPSDSPAASARLRFALGVALPVAQALVLCPVVNFPPRDRPSDRLPPTARRRGSPVLRRPDSPTGQSGVSQVTGPSSSAVPQSTTPPVSLRLAYSASGNAAFRVGDPLSIRNEGFEAAFLRPTRSPDYASTAPSRIQLQVWLPACWLRFDWVGLAPTGRLIRVLVYILTSSPTGIAWSLPPTPHVGPFNCPSLPRPSSARATPGLPEPPVRPPTPGS